MLPPSLQPTDRNIQPSGALIFVKKPKTSLEKCLREDCFSAIINFPQILNQKFKLEFTSINHIRIYRK